MTLPDPPTTTSAPQAARELNVPGGVTARLKARRRRVRLIRKRALAAAASTFALLWGVIFFQLVSGHDPALAHKSSGAVTTTTGASPTTSSSSGPATSGSLSSSGGSAAGASGSGSTSPITTSQS